MNAWSSQKCPTLQKQPKSPTQAIGDIRMSNYSCRHGEQVDVIGVQHKQQQQEIPPRQLGENVILDKFLRFNLLLAHS